MQKVKYAMLLAAYKAIRAVRKIVQRTHSCLLMAEELVDEKVTLLNAEIYDTRRID